MRSALMIHFGETSLEEGFEILSAPKRDNWLVRGRTVERPKGWKMFHPMRGQSIKCWRCGIQADRWVVEKHANDNVGRPTMNLYALGEQGLVMMTRDHIIPKSLGGVDDIANLRPGCIICNGGRGNEITLVDIEFAKAHPELIDKQRVDKGVNTVLKHVRQMPRDADLEIVAAIKPYILMGYL